MLLDSETNGALLNLESLKLIYKCIQLTIYLMLGRKSGDYRNLPNSLSICVFYSAFVLSVPLAVSELFKNMWIVSCVSFSTLDRAL